jgi:uncharacterized Zn finger protein (UPF0148 family)
MICKTCHSPLVDVMSRAKCPMCDRKEIEETNKKEERTLNYLYTFESAYALGY